MLDTADEVRVNSSATFSCRFLRMDVLVLADQKGLYQFCVDTGCSLQDLPEANDDRDGWWEGESGNSVLSARLDDDNNFTQ